MNEMIHLALKTGFSFRQVFGHMEKTIEYAVDGYIGIADCANTFSQYEIEVLCEGNKDLKPIYGVRLNVVQHGTQKIKPRGQFGPEYIFIAKNVDGLKEIYNLVRINYENFYYRGNLSFKDVLGLSKNVIVIAEDAQSTDRLDYIALTTTTPNYMYDVGIEEKIPFVAIVNNFFPEDGDFETYELLVGPRNSCLQTYPQYILSTEEWFDFQTSKNRFRGHLNSAIDNTIKIAKSCDRIILPKAPMIKAKGKTSIEYLCKIGAKNKNINIVDGEYADRYKREMELIKERGYDDYFLVVADMISKAKKKMLVGPGRGSSGGSLVCYIMGITEVDPILHGLMFERFIDVTRTDLPDIDIDFPDCDRGGVIKQLIKDYGDDRVKHIANISRMKSKSAIGNFAKGLGIPPSETEVIKNAIIERSGGDIRSKQCMEDTFKTTEVGKEFVKKYPAMELVARVETHPDHGSVHAAGIIVCNDPIHFYGGINKRDNTVMVNKYGAEYLNLLKIDVLGLRTLSVLGTCAKMVGMDHMDFYDLPLDDEGAYKTFNDHRLNGIFQFEGHSLATLTKKMGIHIFEDIVAITSLARPGALYSGGAARYVKYRLGQDNPVYYGEKHREITEATYGIVVFQEQILRICREIGNMSWKDVNILRRGLSKSYGEAFFAGYKAKYMKGALENGYSEEGAEFVWGEVCYGGNYAFNRCISGETKVRIASPNQYLNRFVSIEELYNKYIYNPNNQIRNKNQLPNIVSLYPDGSCKPQRIKNIFKNGEKECFKYTLENGSSFECTENHRFIIDGKWREIGSAKTGDSIKIGNDKFKQLKIKKGISGKGKIGADKTNVEGFASGVNNPSYINGKTNAVSDFREINEGTCCDICSLIHDRMEIHHNDFNHGYDKPEDLSLLCPSCHKIEHYNNGRNKVWQRGKETSFSKIVSIKSVGMKMTYDIEMPTHHNYILEGGAITHNSHAVAYGLVSYWTAYMKARYPLDFVVACLNNEKDEESSIKILRDAVENDDIEYDPIDPDNSGLHWSVVEREIEIDGEKTTERKIVGGLMNIKGIGITKARTIIKARTGEAKLTPSLYKALISPKTPFDFLYPCGRYFGDMYENPEKYGLSSSPEFIKNVDHPGRFTFIGQLKMKNVRDLNEFVNLQKRDGKVLKDHTIELAIKVEDDTDSIMAGIGRFEYEKIGREIAEFGEIDEDYYIIMGDIRGENSRYVRIKNIMKIIPSDFGFVEENYDDDIPF